MKEFELIEKLKVILETGQSDGIVGIGDDCAVIPYRFYDLGNAEGYELISTDSLVEGVHFSRAYMAPSDVAWKILGVSLSDLAAMGAVPKWCTISLNLPSEVSGAWVESLYRELRVAADAYQVRIIGGNISGARELALCATVGGMVGDSPIYRGGAREGDDIWVSGEVGGAGLGLRLFQGVSMPGVTADERRQWCLRQTRPRPNLELGRDLAKLGVLTSMIDISDGLIQDLGHLARSSGGTFELDLQGVPVARMNQDQAGILSQLVSGEDYELLFTAPVTDRVAIKGVEGPGLGGTARRLTRIGRVLKTGGAQSGVLLPNGLPILVYLKEQGLSGPGFQHSIAD